MRDREYRQVFRAVLLGSGSSGSNSRNQSGDRVDEGAVGVRVDELAHSTVGLGISGHASETGVQVRVERSHHQVHMQPV